MRRMERAKSLLALAEPQPFTFANLTTKSLVDSMRFMRLDVDFLWECCGAGEFAYDALGLEYFGHKPGAVEAAGLLLKPATGRDSTMSYRKGNDHEVVGDFRRDPGDYACATGG
jgi:hypothetical protein